MPTVKVPGLNPTSVVDDTDLIHLRKADGDYKITSEAFQESTGLSEVKTNYIGKDVIAVCRTVADMKLSAITLVNGKTITATEAATIANTGVFIETTWNNTVSKMGGARYELKTLAQHRTDISNPSWTPDGYTNHYLFLGTTYVAVFQGSAIMLEQAGATSTTNSAPNIQACLDNYPVVTFASTITFSSSIWLKSGQTFRGIGGSAKLVPTSNARIRAEKGAGFRSFDNTAQYYNETVQAGTPSSEITANVPKDSYTVTVASATGFAVGDLVFIFNGYCDHWRQLEQGTDPSVWNVDGNDLAAGEVMKIRSINGNVLTFEQPTFYAYPTTVVLYGGLTGENAQPAYTGYNTPRVTKLVGSEYLDIGNFEIDDSANTGTGFYKECISLDQVKYSNISNITIRGGRGILFSNKACFNNVSNIVVDNKVTNGLRFESFCSHNNISNCTFNYREGGDAALLLNLRASHNNITNITVNGYYTTNINSIGVYINGSYNNNLSNITVRNCHGGVAAYFDCFDNNFSNITGHVVGNVLISYFSRRTTFDGFKQTGFMDDAFGFQDKTNVLCFASKQDKFLNGKLRTNATIGMKLEYSRDVVVDKVDMFGQTNGIRIRGETNNAKTKITNCEVNTTNCGVEVIHGDPDDITVRPIIIKNNEITAPRGVALVQVKFVEVIDNKLYCSGTAFELDYSSFWKFCKNKVFGSGTGIGIDHAGFPNGKYLSSYGLAEDNEFNGCTVLFNQYELPALAKQGASTGTRFLDLSVWPNKREMVYTALTPNLTTASSWTITAPYLPISNTTNLTSITNTINTVGKFKGKAVYNDTTDIVVYAEGSEASAAWKEADGTLEHTPV